MSTSCKYIVGIDEVGRGPLAGPVVLGFVKISVDHHDEVISILKQRDLNDSKKVSAQKRRVIFDMVKDFVDTYDITFCTTRAYAQTIDSRGLSDAITQCIRRGLKRLECCPKQTMVFLDGALRAPSTFQNQETVIKGDQKIPTISLASIIAKVTRDNYMEGISAQYPQYGFENHKGYGTTEHCKNIRKHGLSPAHRKSFCKKMR